jgi:hypothetical protein
MTNLRLKPLVLPVLLFKHFDHGLKVADVYRFTKDALRVVMLDDGLDGRH